MRLSRLILSFLILGSVLACAQPEARKPLQKRSGGFMKDSAERNKALYAKEESEILNFIQQRDSLRTYNQSESGFWYSISRTNTQDQNTAKAGDTVIFSYRVYDLTLNEIIPIEANEHIEYLVDQSHQELINGIREGIKLTKNMESIRLLIPSIMAYGYRGIPGVIPSNTPVVVDLLREN